MKIISIEGIDGTGKTTLLNNIKKVSGKGKYISFPTEHFFERYNTYKQDNLLTESILEKLQSEDKEQAIRKLKEQGYEWVICDRFEVTQIVYNKTQNPRYRSDVVVYLELGIDDVFKRIGARQEEDNLGFETRDKLTQLKEDFEVVLKTDYYRDKVLRYNVLNVDYDQEFISGILSDIEDKLEGTLSGE